MSQAIGIGINNPGDLTVTGPNSYLYPGQSGITPHTFQSGNTLYFAQFPDPITGFNALVNSIAGRINNGFNTVATLVYNYLGTSTNNADNPYVANYVATVSNALGVQPNQTITASQAQQVAIGIAQAEGTSSIVPASSSQATSSGSSVGASIGGLFNPGTPSNPTNSGVVTGGQQVDPISVLTGIADYPAAFITGLLGGNTSTTVTGAPANNTPIAQTGADTGAGVNTAVGQATSGLTGWLTQNAIVIAAIAGAAILGVIAIGSSFNNSGGGSKTTVVPIPA